MIIKHIVTYSLFLFAATTSIEPMFRRCIFSNPSSVRSIARRKDVRVQSRFLADECKLGSGWGQDSGVPTKAQHVALSNQRKRRKEKYQKEIFLSNHVGDYEDQTSLFSHGERTVLELLVPMIEPQDETMLFLSYFFSGQVKKFYELLDNDRLAKRVEPYANKLVFAAVLEKKDLVTLKLLVENPFVMRHIQLDDLNKASLLCLAVIHDMSDSTSKQRRIALDTIKLLEEELVKAEK